jgi:SsrA-binding protein
LRVYFKDGRAKVELGIGKGKKQGDRRQDLRREADMREARAAIGRASKHG